MRLGLSSYTYVWAIGVPGHPQPAQQLTEIAAEGYSLARLSIRWVLSQPAITSIILGVSRLAHLPENLAALDDPPLSAESLAACDRVWSKLRGVSPPYNR